jgi:hypothetical protein
VSRCRKRGVPSLPALTRNLLSVESWPWWKASGPCLRVAYSSTRWGEDKCTVAWPRPEEMQINRIRTRTMSPLAIGSSLAVSAVRFSLCWRPNQEHGCREGAATAL